MKLTESKQKRIGVTLVRSVAEELVRFGVINPEGKSDEELHSAVLRYIQGNFINKGEVTFTWVIDHTQMILQEARKFTQVGQLELSCLFYATWFEHWLNDVIYTAGKRRKLSEQEITQIIRETQFRGKSTWLLRILNLGTINETHLKRMQNNIESRNSFVHYKWKRVDIDDEVWEKDKKALTDLLTEVEKTVTYLRRFQGKQFFAGRKRKVLPSIYSKKKRS